MKGYEIIEILTQKTQNWLVFFAVLDFITFWRAGEKTYRRTVIKVHTFDGYSIRNDVFRGVTRFLTYVFAYGSKCYENVMKYFITYFHNIS